MGVVLGFGGGRAPRRRHRGGAVGPAVLLRHPRFVQTVLWRRVGGASPGRGRVLEKERERGTQSEITRDTNTRTLSQQTRGKPKAFLGVKQLLFAHY